MIRAAARGGTTVIAATPHLRGDHPRVRPEELSERCGHLGKLVAAERLDVEIVVGGEVDLLWGLEATDEELRLVSYGQAGSDLLVETPYGPLPPRFDDLLLALAPVAFASYSPTRSGILPSSEIPDVSTP